MTLSFINSAAWGPGGYASARHCGDRISGHAERPRARESIELRLPIQTTGTGAICQS
jgi:hypothetical protein